jgi:hypothetical protein
MAKDKSGLHKKISAIFGSVPIPRNDNMERLPAASEGKSPDCASLQPSVTGQLLSSSLSPRQTAQSSPTAVSSKKFVMAGTVAKTSGQNFWYQHWKQIKSKIFVPKAGVDAGRHKTMVILMPLLLVVFIFIIIRVSNRPSPKSARAQNSEKANVDSSVATYEKKINWQVPDPYPASLRDPMQPGLSAGGQGGNGGLTVKGIVYSEDNSSAVVNSQIVHQGDKISGVTVVKINKNGVEFEMDGRKWTQGVQQ